jgi:hypothetical protein
MQQHYGKIEIKRFFFKNVKKNLSWKVALFLMTNQNGLFIQ